MTSQAYPWFWTKKFSQSTQRRKDIKEYKVYQKTDYSVSRKKRYSKTLCVLKKLGVFALFAWYLLLLNSLHSKKLGGFAYFAWYLLHQLLYNLLIRCNYAGKISWIKKFSQSTLRRKVFKNIKSLQKKIRMFPEKRDTLKLFASPKKTWRLCVLCVRFDTLKLFAH